MSSRLATRPGGPDDLIDEVLGLTHSDLEVSEFGLARLGDGTVGVAHMDGSVTTDVGCPRNRRHSDEDTRRDHGQTRG